MLSRHLYELDEVCLCLRYCLQVGDAKRAVFWARELLLSNEEPLLGKTMIIGWILYLGAPRIQWLDAWTVVGSDIGGCKRLVLIAEFCGLRSHVSTIRVPAMLKCFVMAGRSVSATPSAEKLNAAVEQNDPFGLYWNIGSDKPVDVLAKLSTFVDSPEIFDSIRVAMGSGITSHNRLLLSIAAVQILCLSEYPAPLESAQEQDVATWLHEWEPHIGRKLGRVYEIDTNALLVGEKRRIQSDILCKSALEILNAGCSFWSTELSFLQDDDTLDYIQIKHFPDNMPTTWSAAERLKSHPVESCSVRNKKMKVEEQLGAAYGFIPAMRKSWSSRLKLILKSVSFPDH